MKRAGEKLVELIQQLGGKVPDSTLSDGDLSTIKQYLLSRSKNSMICDDQWTFLKDILRSTEYSCRAINIIGGDQFISTQTNGGLDELPKGSGFVQFGYWDGNGGGDAWVLDLHYDMIRCVGASLLGTVPMPEVRAYSYGAFPQADWFYSFMYGVATQRGWLTIP